MQLCKTVPVEASRLVSPSSRVDSIKQAQLIDSCADPLYASEGEDEDAKSTATLGGHDVEAIPQEPLEVEVVMGGPVTPLF